MSAGPVFLESHIQILYRQKTSPLVHPPCKLYYSSNPWYTVLSDMVRDHIFSLFDKSQPRVEAARTKRLNITAIF